MSNHAHEKLTPLTTFQPAASNQGRCGSRRKPDWGLPSPAALEDLATTYLELQARLWPKLANDPHGPLSGQPTELADAFRCRFLAGASEPVSVPALSPKCPTLGAAYLRYSSDNSNPRSLAQQLRNVLERAHREGIFIPWPYVCADAAVTGTLAVRNGYLLLKSLIEAPDGPACVFIDEVGRASRDLIEALRLGRLVERTRKRLVGVTDGFDSSCEQSRMMLAMHAMFHEHHVDGLRHKVRRGMADAFRQGHNIRPPAIGYRLVDKTDEQGQTVLKPKNGLPVRVKAIDESQAAWVRQAFELYGRRKWSPLKIARLFNQHKVGGRATWDNSRIMQLLRNELYVGREYERKTRYHRDPDTGRCIIEQLPREEWLCREVPHLRIIDEELWQTVQERLKERSRAWSRNPSKRSTAPPRTTLSPTALFRPLCGYCQRPLMLYRGGRYQSFCCAFGNARKHDCQLYNSKSVAIVERSILQYLQEQVFTEQFLTQVVEAANRYLEEMAQRPPIDLTPLDEAIGDLRARRDRLIRLAEEGGQTSLESVARRIGEIEAELHKLTAERAEHQAQNGPVPPPLVREKVLTLLDPLRDLLRQNIEVAAPLLAKLTGPITVTLAPESDDRHRAWLAHFTVNAAPVLVELARAKNCPNTRTLEYLDTHDWTMQAVSEVRLERQYASQRVASEAAELLAKGLSMDMVARALDCSRETVVRAMVWLRTGKRLKYPPRPARARRPRRRRAPSGYYRNIASQVVELRKSRGWSFGRIAQELEVCESTVRRAYDHYYADALRASAAAGEPFRRARNSRHSRRRHEQAIAALLAGQKGAQIAETLGMSRQTVYRIRKRLVDSGQLPPGPRSSQQHERPNAA